MTSPQKTRNMSKILFKKLTLSWNVICSKSIIYTEEFISSCKVFSHHKFSDKDNKLRLKDFEILIFKKDPIFESVLKNILT